MATFYELVLDASPRNEPSGDIRLISDRDEVLVHTLPKSVAQNIEITSPPRPRESAALKPIFDVASLEIALQRVEAAGGVVTERTFTLDGITRHDAIDPDGNVIQLRCPSS
jgi:hypothetical protein